MPARMRLILRSSQVAMISLMVGLVLGCNEIDLESLTNPARLAERARSLATKGDGDTNAAPIAASASDTKRGSEAGRERSTDMESIGGASASRVYYQFIDDRGGVHFVERLADVPPAWHDRVGFVEMDRPPPLTPAEARQAWTLSTAETSRILAANPPAARRSGPGGRQSAGVILYSAVWCGYCTKARQHLDEEGVDYEVRDVDIKAVAQELREKTGRGGVPVLDYDGQILRGYSASQYRKAISEIQGRGGAARPVL